MCSSPHTADGLTSDAGLWLCGPACVAKWYAEPAQVGTTAEPAECDACTEHEKRIDELRGEIDDLEHKNDELRDEIEELERKVKT